MPLPIDGRKPLPRRTSAQTRELLLAGGLLVADDAIASEDGQRLSDWLAHIHLDQALLAAKHLQIYLAETEDVLPEGNGRAAWLRQHRNAILSLDASGYRDITKSIVYSVFDGEDDFRARLAHRLLDLDRVTDGGTLASTMEELRIQNGGQLPPVSKLVAILADAEFERMRNSESTFVKLGASAFAGNPEIRRLLQATLYRSAYDEGELVELYESALALSRRRPRHGATVEDIFTALSGLIYGLSFHHRSWPESVREDIPWEDGSWSIFALAAQAIWLHLTEPIPTS